MQDGTYPSRDFATLGLSGLQPPFTGTYNSILYYFFILQHRAGVRLYTSYFYFAKSYVFNKQSLPPLRSYYLKLSLSRSYREILPSSFSIIHSFIFIYSINLPVLVFVRFILSFFPVFIVLKIKYLTCYTIIYHLTHIIFNVD